MATIKKYNGSTWENTTARKYETKSEIITPPTTIYADGTAITSYTIKGNTVQNGTPTPSNPVEVNGVGVRTENLLGSFTEGYAIDENGTIYANSAFMYFTAPCQANETYTFSLDSGLSDSIIRVHAFNGDTWIEQTLALRIQYAPLTFTTPQNTTNLKISIIKDALQKNCMLNDGQTAKPFEPWGYKIPISNGQQTNNNYLGEVQTTRQIRKLVLTGNEDWSHVVGATSISAYYRFKVGSLNSVVINEGEKCTHYQHQAISSSSTYIGFSTQNSTGYNGAFVAFRPYENSSESELATWKSYLAAQYAAGTPVIVWYVLATEETAVVNEPLMKIGDYADTLSNATAIPTTEGANSITVDTTVQPSEFTATWTGWHNANVKEWDGSDWQ